MLRKLWDDLIEDAVAKGIDAGFMKALVESCDGRYERDRCPVAGTACACEYDRYLHLPWWRKIFTKEPEKPTGEACMNAIIWQETGI